MPRTPKTLKPSSIPVPAVDETEIRHGLPHLFAFGWYKWALEFRDTREKLAFLCAGNQISKSSTQIRTVIEWATNKRLWPELWPKHHQNVNLFWYLYPSQKVVNAEFQTKWMQFLPRGRFKEHPTYGWKVVKDNGQIVGVQFNSGLLLLFKTYSQKESDLQSGTVYALFCFAAGTQISVPGGTRAIEEIREGDIVLTHDGPRRVTLTASRLAQTIERKIGDTWIRSTGEHPFWTQNRGWAQFGTLTENDECVQLPECSISKEFTSFYLRGAFTLGKWTRKILDRRIILGRMKRTFYTSLSGKNITEDESPKVMSSTTLTTSPSIIALKIFNFFHAQNTQPTTNVWNGAKRRRTPSIAFFAGWNSYRDRVRPVSPGTAGWCAEENRTDEAEYVRNVVKNLLREKTLNSVFALTPAPINTRHERVYNIQVEGAHTYYANRILVHNCDEELPMRHYYELMMRVSAVSGYFRMVFTATLGQDFWRKVMEPDLESGEVELLPHAWKRQVSLYDALEYADGSPGGWSLEAIEAVRHNCPTHEEVQKRVWGRFVVSLEDRKYPSFDAKKAYIRPHKIPMDWNVFVGVDIGSGNVPGATYAGHPAAIMFLAVNPEYTSGLLFLGWRGDNIGNTTAGDVMEHYLRLKNEHKLLPVRKFYDQSCRDFLTISQRLGEGFEASEKSHAVGDEILNLLFKHGMLKVFSGDPELQKFGWEISSVKRSTPKGKRKDDIVDAARYAITSVPWQFPKFEVSHEHIVAPIVEESYEEECLRKRRQRAKGVEENIDALDRELGGERDELQAEFDDLNSLYGSG